MKLDEKYKTILKEKLDLLLTTVMVKNGFVDVDSVFSNWIVLYKWLTYINNNKDRYGRERDSYKVDATLRVLDNFRNEILVIDLVGVWINMLGEISLTYREGSQNLESAANFIYDRYEIRNI